MRIQYRLILLMVILPFFFSACKNGNNVRNQVLNAIGKNVPIPDNYMIYKNGKIDSLSLNFDDLTIVSFSNYAVCPSCDIMKIEDWFTLATEIEDLNCSFVYIVNNKIDRNIKAQVINDRNNVSIMLADDKLFNEFANKIAPINTFLVDKNKKIVLVGNPVHNDKLWNLYKKAILRLR